MNTRLFTRVVNEPVNFPRFVLVLGISLFLVQTARAEIVELSIAGRWTEKDFKVTSRKDGRYDPANPKFDGLVFGVAPIEGSVTLQLLINTDGNIFFAKGAEFAAEGVGAYTLSHDFYGYRDVTLVGGSFTFGGAVWGSDGILAGLEGPERVKAALWTDTDITKKTQLEYLSVCLAGRTG